MRGRMAEAASTRSCCQMQSRLVELMRLLLQIDRAGLSLFGSVLGHLSLRAGKLPALSKLNRPPMQRPRVFASLIETGNRRQV